MRIARQEDFDELVPIFGRQSSALKARNSDFYLAELIAATDPCNLSLTAETCDGQVVGFMNVTCRVDLEALRSQYDLQVCSNLQSLGKLILACYNLVDGWANGLFLREIHVLLVLWGSF